MCFNVWFAQGTLAIEALAKKKKLSLSVSLALCLPLEMIRAVRAAWNHYWCTLMKSHLFEVQAVCLSSRACVFCVCVCVSEQACIHLSVPVCEISLSPSAKPTPLKTHCREELEINLWGNLIPLKCQAHSSNRCRSSNICHQPPIYAWNASLGRHVSPLLHGPRALTRQHNSFFLPMTLFLPQYVSL